MFLGVRLNWAVWLSQGTQYLLMKMSPTRKMLKTKGIEIVKWTAVVFFTYKIILWTGHDGGRPSLFHVALGEWLDEGWEIYWQDNSFTWLASWFWLLTEAQAGDVGHRLLFLSFVFLNCFDFITAWWLDFKSEHFKRTDIFQYMTFQTCLWKSCNITFIILYWSRHLQKLPRHEGSVHVL